MKIKIIKINGETLPECYSKEADIIFPCPERPYWIIQLKDNTDIIYIASGDVLIEGYE